MISNYEKQYIKILKNIMDNGYLDNNRTKYKAKKLPHQIIQVDLSKEFPILKTKQVFWKTATKEILWIMQKQSNVVQDLRDVGCKVWNEWEQEDGTIGKAYGYQVKKYKQIDKLIESLKNNPQNRRMLINLWNNEDLEDMALQPCCFLSIWDVTNGKLNCMLVQRSGDMGLGVPFNTTQYAILTHMIAQVCGLKVGLLTHVINNTHIYENHFNSVIEQINRYNKLYNSNDVDENIIKSNPILKLNPNINNFYDFKIEDINIKNYFHMGKLNMGNVAV